MTGISFAQIVGVAKQRSVSLPGELAGYLVLGVVDKLGGDEARVAPSDIWLKNDGRVLIGRFESCSPACRDRALRELLAQLLDVAASTPQALLRASSSAGHRASRAFANELLTALIPVNRGAARRALSRLYREAEAAVRVGGIGNGADSPWLLRNGCSSGDSECAPMQRLSVAQNQSDGTGPAWGGAVQERNNAVVVPDGLTDANLLHDSDASGQPEAALRPESSDVFKVASASAVVKPRALTEHLADDGTRVSPDQDGVARSRAELECAFDELTAALPLINRRNRSAPVVPTGSLVRDWDQTAVDAVVEISDNEIQYLDPEFVASSPAVLSTCPIEQKGLDSEETLYRSHELRVPAARSTVEILSQQFPHEPLWSEAELCQRLRSVAGFDQAMCGHPRDLSQHVSAAAAFGASRDPQKYHRSEFVASAAC